MSKTNTDRDFFKCRCMVCGVYEVDIRVSPNGTCRNCSRTPVTLGIPRKIGTCQSCGREGKDVLGIVCQECAHENRMGEIMTTLEVLRPEEPVETAPPSAQVVEDAYALAVAKHVPIGLWGDVISTARELMANPEKIDLIKRGGRA